MGLAGVVTFQGGELLAKSEQVALNRALVDLVTARRQCALELLRRETAARCGQSVQQLQRPSQGQGLGIGGHVWMYSGLF